MGYKVFILCLKQLLGNWRIALRLSWVWVLVYAIAVFWAERQSGPGPAVLSGEQSQPSFAMLRLLYFIIWFPLVVIVSLGITSIAISWHRFILLGEVKTGLLALQPIKNIGAYLWRGIKVGVIVFVITLPVIFITGFILSSFIQNNISAMDFSNLFFSFMLVIIISSTAGAFFTWLFLRLGLVLPAISVGKDLSIRQSYQLTEAFGGRLIVTAFLITLLQQAPTFVLLGGLYFFGKLIPFWFAMPFQLIFQWLLFFVSFGVLTVLYGHLVEERPL